MSTEKVTFLHYMKEINPALTPNGVTVVFEKTVTIERSELRESKEKFWEEFLKLKIEKPGCSYERGIEKMS